MTRRKSTPSKRKGPPSLAYKIGSKNFYMRPKLLRTIRKLQSSTDLLIPKQPFSRAVREVMQDIGEHNFNNSFYRIQLSALKALQEASELYLIGLFEESNMAAAHASRITIQPRDMQFILAIRGSWDVFNH